MANKTFTVWIDNKAVEQKYVFANKDRSEIVVTTISSILEGGTPIDSDNGEDLEYIGVAWDGDDVPRKLKVKVGTYRLHEHYTDIAEAIRTYLAN